MGDLQKSNSEGCQKLLSLLNLLLSKNVIWSALVAREPFGGFSGVVCPGGLLRVSWGGLGGP